MTKTNLVMKGFILLTTLRSGSIIERHEGSHSRQELMQRNVAYWFVHHPWLSLLSYTTEDFLPRVGTSYSGMDPSTPITNQQTVPEVCLRLTFEGLSFSFN